MIERANGPDCAQAVRACALANPSRALEAFLNKQNIEDQHEGRRDDRGEGLRGKPPIYKQQCARKRRRKGLGRETFVFLC